MLDTIARMAAQKITITMDEADLIRARAGAQRAGISLSAWLTRAARSASLRDAGQRYNDWLADNPEVATDLAEWRQITAATMSQRWAGLEGAA